MYADTALIRKHTVKISLSDQEAALLASWSNYTGEQKAVLVRESFLNQAMQVMSHEPDHHAAA